MKKLSDALKELNIKFSFPIKIKDANGNTTYYETSNGYWFKREYDPNGNTTYYERSNGYWFKREYDPKGNQTYYENSNGIKRGTPRSAKTCEGKIVEIDGVKYELKAL